MPRGKLALGQNSTEIMSSDKSEEEEVNNRFHCVQYTCCHDRII